MPPQDTANDAHIRSIIDFSPQLNTQDTEQLKTIWQRQQQLNNRPVPEPEAVGLGEGAEGPPQTQPHTLSLRWNSFHGNLLRYQQQLEAALEIHGLSQKLDDITQQVREKVSSGGADTAKEQCLPPLAHLSSSPGYLEAGPTRRPSVGLPGALRVSSGPRSPHLLPGGWPYMLPFSPRSTVSPEARATPPPHVSSVVPEQSQNPREVCWALCQPTHGRRWQRRESCTQPGKHPVKKVVPCSGHAESSVLTARLVPTQPGYSVSVPCKGMRVK